MRQNAEISINVCRVERTTILVDGAQFFFARFFIGGDVPLWERRFASVPARRAAISDALTRADAAPEKVNAPWNRPVPDRTPRLPAALYDDLLGVWDGGSYGGGMGSPLGQTPNLNSFTDRCGRLIHDPLGSEDVAVYVGPSGSVLVVVCFWDGNAYGELADNVAWSFEILLSDCSDDLIGYVQNEVATNPLGATQVARQPSWNPSSGFGSLMANSR